jgi:hypothetical protein
MATMLMALLVLPMQAMANAASQSAYSAKRHSDTVLHLKFAESDEVVLANGQFISKNGKDLSQVNTKLSSAKVAKKSRLFTASPEAIKAQRQNLSAKLGNSYVPNLNNYYRIVLKAGQNIDTVVASLKQSMPSRYQPKHRSAPTTLAAKFILMPRLKAWAFRQPAAIQAL